MYFVSSCALGRDLAFILFRASAVFRSFILSQVRLTFSFVPSSESVSPFQVVPGNCSKYSLISYPTVLMYFSRVGKSEEKMARITANVYV